ncbi:ABC transporter ATP-binding protein [Acuticoccus sp. MNP-M23]|uniref:ABC transporter ATP-binding protein n=1 Tax=Acuticoccus sp. MNP-M23 TaxID=3072793 RepID=UPI0028166527|nr:ABC transporter ATP-binding protein [Acuticoccus sp. MNP-M23]WMS41925.1 ABC transporter ATP-binding protein [Acuticoccus sp. MNP-M23]
MSGGAETVLRLRGISCRFGPVVANEDVSLDLRRGEILALLGENGAGKTTLMNILFGHYTADSGTVEVFGRPLPPGDPAAALDAGVGMVHQHFTLAGNLTVEENIVLGTEPLWRPARGRRVAQARIAELSRTFGLAVDPAVKVGDLTVGERQRVEILKALYRDARILVLDEPTAVLTPQEATALFETLRHMAAQGLAVIVISHKLHEVLAVAERAVVLRRGRVVGEVKTAETDRAGLAALMVGGTVELPSASSGTPGPVRLALTSVVTRPRRGPGLAGVTLALRAGEITGIAGVAGNGQSALAALIAGLERPATGTLEVDGVRIAAWSPARALAAGIGRIPEDRHHEGTVADFSIAENAILEGHGRRPFARAGILDRARATAHAREIIAGYDVRCPGPELPARLLSGGNMQKLILGRVLEAAPGIILANQPVRGLDVGAIAFVEKKLIAARDAGAAVILISEDLDEILALADVVHVISEGRLSRPFARGTANAADLGLLMGGHGFETERDAA